MTSHSLVPKAAAAIGIDFEELCWRILETSFDGGGARMNNRALLKLLAWTIALALIALPVVGMLNGWFATDRWPVKFLQVEAEYNHVSAEQIRAAAATHLGTGFFALNLEERARARSRRCRGSSASKRASAGPIRWCCACANVSRSRAGARPPDRPRRRVVQRAGQRANCRDCRSSTVPTIVCAT